MGLQTLSSYEKAESERVSRQIQMSPRSLLQGNQSFTSRALQAGGNLIDERAIYARALDPADMTLDQSVGVFEGWSDWVDRDTVGENPFERLVDSALNLVFGALLKDEVNNRVFLQTATDNAQPAIDVEFNMRVGIALSVYSEKSARNAEAGIGRSLVLSCLALSDDAGNLPERVRIDEDNDYTTSEQIDAVKVYSLFPPSGYYPHAQSLGSAMNGVWAWTVDPAIKAVFEGNILEITLDFPAGGTHYLLVRGIKPFSRIQIRGMDYRTDPRFEQYDSPGWVYSSSEQTLLIKMLHKTQEERIRVVF
jgi:hypothetical protein